MEQQLYIIRFGRDSIYDGMIKQCRLSFIEGRKKAPKQLGCFNEVGPIFIDGKTGYLKVTENHWG